MRFALLAVMHASVADAHERAGTSAASYADWNGGPWIIVAVAMTAVLYAWGSWRYVRSAPRASRAGSQMAWWFGWTVLALVLMSPLDAWSAELFSVHMIQHELLMMVAAPLLVLGKPLAMFAWALPPGWAARIGCAFHVKWWRQAWRWLTLPAIAWLVHAIALWGWHIPALFEAGLRHPAIHDLQHLCFFGSALLFWWALVRRRRRAESTIYVFTTLVHTGALGMLLTFAVTPWYAFYAQTAPRWGLTPLEDQQMGGLIMWVPSGALLIVAGLLLANGWLRRLGRPVRARIDFANDP